HNPDCRYTPDEIRSAIERHHVQDPPAFEPSVSVPTDSKAEEDDGLAGVEFLQDDNQLLDQARSAENGVKFQRLWEGDDALHNGDRSAADLALCDILAFWTGKDVSRMDRL